MKLYEIWTSCSVGDVDFKKNFLSRALAAPLFSGLEPIGAMLEKGMRNKAVKLFEFRTVVQEKMTFKGTVYVELWQPFRSAERNHL